MAKRLPILLRRAALFLFSALAPLAAVSPALAQFTISLPPLPSGTSPQPFPKAEPKIFQHYPDTPSLSPIFTIPLGALGFTDPGPYYFLRRQSLVSLDFIDENRLLFTFKVPGLMDRDAGAAPVGKQRRVRAEVVVLPAWHIQSDTFWTIPDSARYLWMLNDGHFLLRDENGLEQGDANLKIAPFLHLPGSLLWLELDPSQKIIITNSLETAAPQGPADAAAPTPDPAAKDAETPKPGEPATLVARTMQRENGKLLKISRVPFAQQSNDLPINSEGYIESAKNGRRQWTLNLNSFTGGVRVVASVDSACAPRVSYLSDAELLADTCDPSGGQLIAISSTGAHLWEIGNTTNAIWPLIVRSPNGSRFAQETLLLKRPVSRYKHRLLGAGDFLGQMVKVFDAADGNVLFEAPLNPVLDGGGNVAISPSGRRIAILNDGAIQVFELPTPSPAPGAAKK